jgi:single-strand DNA-binding protein
MASYNRVIMMGNLTRDPEYKQLASGQAVCRLGLASNRQFKNRQTGMMVQEVCFVDIDVWGPQADSCNQYLQKGRGVLVEGRLKLDSWTDQEGQRRSKHSIVADRVTFLSSNASEEQMEDIGIASEETMKAPKPKKAKTGNNVPTLEEAKKEKKSSNGEVELSDDEPFEDDLPF